LGRVPGIEREERIVVGEERKLGPIRFGSFRREIEARQEKLLKGQGHFHVIAEGAYGDNPGRGLHQLSDLVIDSDRFLLLVQSTDKNLDRDAPTPGPCSDEI